MEIGFWNLYVMQLRCNPMCGISGLGYFRSMGYLLNTYPLVQQTNINDISLSHGQLKVFSIEIAKLVSYHLQARHQSFLY